jgi:uncharacterized protein
MSHSIETIQTVYQAFGRGDIPAILALLAPDVRWEDWGADHSAQRAGVPTMQPRRGPDGVMAFFAEVAKMQIHDFQVLDLFGGATQVAAEVEIEFTVPLTGMRVRDQELHLWTFGADGRIVRMRHYIDTAKHIRAHGLAAS